MMSETWIDWRVIFERDMKKPGFKESYERAKRKIEAEEAVGRFLTWEEVLAHESGIASRTKRKRISLLKMRRGVKKKHSVQPFKRTVATKAAQI